MVGSGIAGLTCALHLREAGLHVTVVTKVNIDDGSTRWAQGGIAAVLDPLDTPEAHAADTLVAGVGLCDPAAVDVLVREGPARVRELIRWGTRFDRGADGALLLTREGGHHANRIVHAGGDATGAEVQRALHAAVRRDPWIRLIEHALVLDLLTDDRGRACGVTLHVLGEGSEDGVGSVLARAVVLATGGMGQIFAATTNPVVSTGDGVALALRAGRGRHRRGVRAVPPDGALPRRRGGPRVAQQPLVSEAMRGEGAHLVDARRQAVHGRPARAGRAGPARRRRQGDPPGDARDRHRPRLSSTPGHMPDVDRRFPSITAPAARPASTRSPTSSRSPRRPTTPAAGSAPTSMDGRRSPGLYACGEVACTGVHGANRLASNSLLEGLVFARRIAADIATGLPAQTRSGAARRRPAGPCRRPCGQPLQQAMTRGAGVLRSADVAGRHRGGAGRARGGPGRPRGRTRGRRRTCSRWPACWSPRPGGAPRPAAVTGARTSRDAGPSGPATCWRRSPTDGAVAPALGGAVNALAHRRRARRCVADGPRRGRGRRGSSPTALAEDLGGPDGVDVTSVATIPADQRDVADLVARADGVVAGLAVAAAVFDLASAGTVDVRPRRSRTATGCTAAQVLATVAGPTRALLTAERTALNLLCRLSGVATHTRAWADALAGTKARVLDTRKTTPGLRALEKYAVRAGGGTNKRMGLYDVAMVKDNHKLAAGGVAAAYRAGPGGLSGRAGPGRGDHGGRGGRGGRGRGAFLLCDNMSVPLLREVVAAVGGRAELEATGGLTLERGPGVRRDRRRLPVGRRADPLVADPRHRDGPAPGSGLGCGSLASARHAPEARPSGGEDQSQGGRPCCCASTSGTRTPCWPRSRVRSSCTAGGSGPRPGPRRTSSG